MIRRKKQMIIERKIDGSTRLTQVTFTMTFFFFLLGNLIKQMSLAGSRVNIDSALLYPFEFYFTSILITSLIFTLVYALRYSYHEFYTFINFIDQKKIRGYEEIADNSYISFLNNFKQQLTVIVVVLFLFQIIYGIGSPTYLLLFIVGVFISLLLIMITEKKARKLKRTKLIFLKETISSKFEKSIHLSLKYSIFILVTVYIILFQYDSAIDKYFNEYTIEFIDGETPLISIIADFNISKNLKVYIADADNKDNIVRIDNCYYSLNSSHLVNEITNEPSQGKGMFGIRNESYYNLSAGFERYHILIPIIDNYGAETNIININFSNEKKSVAITNHLFWEGETGKFIENIVKGN